jgi:type III secretion protein D
MAMKRIRILTGRHTGSSLDLTEGVHRIGAGQDCEVMITDWDFEPVTLEVTDESVKARWEVGADREGQPGVTSRHQFENFAARRFGNIVVCVGPSDANWPADVELLDHVFQPTPERVARWAGKRLLGHHRPTIAIAAACALVVLVGLGLWLHHSTPPAPTLQAARRALQASLDRVIAGRLAVSLEAQSLVVTGIVDNPSQAAQVRQSMASLRGPYPAVPRFAVASDVAQAIRDGASLPNATVRYAGKGVFEVVADSMDPKATHAALDRVRADLAPIVSRIDVTLEVTEVPDATPIRSRMTSEGLSVVQTRDGVKHMVMQSADDSPVSVDDVLALPSPLTPRDPPVARAPTNP